MPLGDDQTHRKTAERIQRENPNWLVVWGAYSRQYTAFALFDAPPGIVLRGQDPNELASRMRQAEQFLAAQPRRKGGS